MIESLFDEKPLVLIGASKPEAAVAGLLNLFPVSCRRELSFTTGLKFSPRRPFRLLVASQESAELRRLYRQQLVSVVDLGAAAKASPTPVTNGWAAYIADAVARDAISQLVERLRERQDGLHLGDLHELGESCRHEAPSYIVPIRSRSEVRDRAGSLSAAVSNPPCNHDDESKDSCKCSAEIISGRAASADDSQVLVDEVSAAGREEDAVRQRGSDGRGHQPASSGVIEPDSQQVLDELERLDDVVFDAMSGDERAIDEMGRMWPQLLAKLGPDQLDESREQYLRHSLSVWETCLDSGLREPERALASLQVLSILFGEK
jgi:hypothetical protein